MPNRSRKHLPHVAAALPILAMAAALALFTPAALAASGGSEFVVVPRIQKVSCVSECAGAKADPRVRGGGILRISGTDMDQTVKVLFVGSSGGADDVAVTPISASSTAVRVKVPAGSASGPLRAVTSPGLMSKRSPWVTILPAPPVIAAPTLKSVRSDLPGVSLKAGATTPRSVFLGAKKLVRYDVLASGAADLVATVRLVLLATGVEAANWRVDAPDGQLVSVSWDGKTGDAPGVPGRYAFSVTLAHKHSDATAGLSAPAPALDASRDAFDLHDFIFPLRGKHYFGMGAGRFGGGRGHQGQDILANCGLKLVAARGGTVVESRTHPAAGNFIVIRPDAPGVGDEAYMHMPKLSPFRKGDRVYTGQEIGRVGQTGHASACHLHFEQWTGEIWRSKPVDPLPALKAWDLIS
jgi:murein DD-endopeptidase MepM/ murein hydrolase activator NlpD